MTSKPLPGSDLIVQRIPDEGFPKLQLEAHLNNAHGDALLD